MGGKLGKKGLNVAHEKPTEQRTEKATEAATVKPAESEEVCPAVESMGPTTEKRDKDQQGSGNETEDKEGGRIPAEHAEKICKSEPRQLDLVPNEEQIVPAASEEATESPEADPSQLLEATAPKGVESRQEGDA